MMLWSALLEHDWPLFLELHEAHAPIIRAEARQIQDADCFNAIQTLLTAKIPKATRQAYAATSQLRRQLEPWKRKILRKATASRLPPLQRLLLWL